MTPGTCFSTGVIMTRPIGEAKSPAWAKESLPILMRNWALWHGLFSERADYHNGHSGRAIRPEANSTPKIQCGSYGTYPFFTW
jgi:hypothetical protein